jgi:hypothetical protein
MATILNEGWDFTHNSESGTAKFISTQESEDTILMSLIFSPKYALLVQIG